MNRDVGAPSDVPPGAASPSPAPSVVLAAAEQRAPQIVDDSLVAQWVYSREELQKRSPSVADGCTPEEEASMRRDAAEFITRVFDTFHREEKFVRRETQALALLLFHRFYARCSMVVHDRVLIATAAMLLACKIDSRPRYLAEFAAVYAERIDHSRALDMRSERGVAIRDAIVAAERTLLEVIEFDFHSLLLPYEFIGGYLTMLGVGAGDDVEKLAAQAATSAMKTSLPVQYSARALAAAAVLVALRIRRVAVPPGAAARLPVDGRALSDILAQISEASQRGAAAGAGGGEPRAAAAAAATATVPGGTPQSAPAEPAYNLSGGASSSSAGPAPR